MSDYTPVPLEVEVSVDARITEELIRERRRHLEQQKQEIQNIDDNNNRKYRTHVVRYYLRHAQKEHIVETLAQMAVDDRCRALLVEEEAGNVDMIKTGQSYERYYLTHTPLSKLDINHSEIADLVPCDMCEKSIMDIIGIILPEDCRVYTDEGPPNVYRITLHRGPLYTDPMCQIALTYHKFRSLYTLCSFLRAVLCFPFILPCIDVHLFSSYVCCDKEYYSRRRLDKDST